MNIAIGILAGLLWGALGALINYFINRAALKKQSSGALVAASIARMAVDLVILGAVFLLRRALPFPFEAALLSAGVTLSLGSIALAFYIARKK